MIDQRPIPRLGETMTYPGTLASLEPAPDRPNDAWTKTDKPPIMARDIKPLWAGNLAKQRRPRK